MSPFKSFVCGSLLTFVVGAALFGQVAQAEPVQQSPRTASSHLVTLGYDGNEYHISADLIDLITTYETEPNMVEMHVISINEYTGEQTEICNLTLPQKLAQDFVKEANRYRP